MQSAIEIKINTELKNSMKSGNVALRETLRMVLTESKKFQTSAENSNKELSDDTWLKIISAYVKSLNKSLDEYVKINNESCTETINKIKFELEYWTAYLPKTLNSDETLVLVLETIKTLQATSKKDTGKVVGFIMKNNKNVDGKLVKFLVDQHLS